MKKSWFILRWMQFFPSALLFFITGAMLLFSARAYFDGLQLRQSIASTAYIGTVFNHTAQNAWCTDLPLSIKEQIEQARGVSSTMRSDLFAAKAPGLTRVADVFGATFSLEKKLFLSGTVSAKPERIEMPAGTLIQFGLGDLHCYAGEWQWAGMVVGLLQKNTEIPLAKGDRVFLVGRYTADAEGKPSSLIVYAADIAQAEGMPTEDPVWSSPFLRLPRNCTDAQAEALISAFLDDTGLRERCEIINALEDAVSVRTVSDMGLLPGVARGAIEVTLGRELSPSDAGQKVCVVDSIFAAQNGLTVGDTISLQIAPDCYRETVDKEEYARQSGYPFSGDAVLPYAAYGGFEIVGIYTQATRNGENADVFAFNHNEILIPQEILPAKASVQAGCFSFSVQGAEYEAFLSENEEALWQQGYALSMADMGYTAFAQGFSALAKRHTFEMCGAGAAFLIAAAVFALLLIFRFRTDFARKRLLGATRREAFAAAQGAFFLTGLPSVALAAVCAFLLFRVFWAEPFAQNGVSMPGDITLLGVFSALACAELLAAYLCFLLCGAVLKRQNLIRLLR